MFFIMKPTPPGSESNIQAKFGNESNKIIFLLV